MRHFSAVIRTRRWIVLFSLTVLLPALFLGLLAVRAFKGEQIRQLYQHRERQQQIVRLLESEINTWLLSLPSGTSPLQPSLQFHLENGQIIIPELNVLIAHGRPTLLSSRITEQDARRWQVVQRLEKQPQGRQNALIQFRRLAESGDVLAPLARLHLLRLALDQRAHQEAVGWLNRIREKDAGALTESGIPIWMGAGLLLASRDFTSSPAPYSDFLRELQQRLWSGHWKLSGAQWIFYTRTISTALEIGGRPPEAKVERVQELVECLENFLPEAVVLSRATEQGAPLAPQREYLPQHQVLLVVFAGPEKPPNGYLLEAGTVKELLDQRLDDLTSAEDFSASAAQLEGAQATEEGVRLASFPSFIIRFQEKAASHSLLDFRRHFFLYSAGFLLLFAIFGLVLTYRAVSHEMAVARLKADFVSAVSHEFRSPLAAIQALLERLDTGRVRDPEMSRRYHHVLREEVQRLGTLVDELLDFARLEEGRKEFRFEPWDVLELTRQSLQSFHNLGYGHRVKLLAPETNSLVAWVDRTAIAQCIHNLIDNAIKYSPPEAPVTVSLGRDNGEIFLEVSDQGPGIPASDQERIFEQFYRGHDADKQGIKGAGLGLALVKRIMERHGGRITLKSQPGLGSAERGGHGEKWGTGGLSLCQGGFVSCLNMDTVSLFLALGGIVIGAAVTLLIMQVRLKHTFKSLAAQALIENNQTFVVLAKTTLERFQAEARGELTLKEKAIQELVHPLKHSLERYEQQLLELERKREQAYGGLRQYLDNVASAQVDLRKETGNLAKALRSSNVRGKWGEVGLRRVVELAGMTEHCDFKDQELIAPADSRLRPDLVVYLPQERQIVIDAKVPLDSYLQAVEAESEEERERCMAEHCRQLQRHITLLSGKAYWDQLEGSPEFVVLFIPLESLYSAALRYNPRLIEEGMQKKVILATPTTLIGLLKAIEYGWRQQKLAQNAFQISAMGKELYERLFKVAEHLARLGANLDRSVQAYNETVGSFESRVFVQARRFRELGVAGKEEIPEAPWIDRSAREPRCTEAGELEETDHPLEEEAAPLETVPA